MREHIVHLLERNLLGLGKESIEEECVGEIADHEEEVVAVFDMLHGDGGHLANHGVEGEGDTGRDRDTL